MGKLITHVSNSNPAIPASALRSFSTLSPFSVFLIRMPPPMSHVCFRHAHHLLSSHLSNFSITPTAPSHSYPLFPPPQPPPAYPHPTLHPSPIFYLAEDFAITAPVATTYTDHFIDATLGIMTVSVLDLADNPVNTPPPTPHSQRPSPYSLLPPAFS